MNDLKANLNNVRSRVESACKMAGRDPSKITVLAVSKRHSAARIRALHELGQRAFGENYLQEAVAKQTLLAGLALEWHFIGPLQSNKTKEIARNFDWVQSADREKVLRRLSEQRPENMPALNICLQVNIDYEAQKAGVMPEDLEQLARFVMDLKNLHLRGLMAIPRQASADHDPSDSYRRVHELFMALNESGIPMDTLSMGMSADLESAIMQGSTMIRIGTDLLGARNETNG